MATPTEPGSMGQPQASAGSEVLLLEKDDHLRESLNSLLTSAGLAVTATNDVVLARQMLREKHFAVAILDMDTPEDWSGVEVMKAIRASSPATNVMILSHRETFERALQAFRGGAKDVVAKRSKHVEYIVNRVVELCGDVRRHDERVAVLRQASEFLELGLKQLMDLHRRCEQLDPRSGASSGRLELEQCVLLVVDDNSRTAPGLQEALSGTHKYHCDSIPTGGEALDHAGGHPFHIALVKEELPDLPGSMVAKSLSTLNPDGLVLMFRDPASGPGRVYMIEDSKVVVLVPELTKGAQLVKQIHRLREAYVAKANERRYLRAFREHNYDYLKQYVELRKKIEDLL